MPIYIYSLLPTSSWCLSLKCVFVGELTAHTHTMAAAAIHLLMAKILLWGFSSHQPKIFRAYHQGVASQTLYSVLYPAPWAGGQRGGQQWHYFSAYSSPNQLHGYLLAKPGFEPWPFWWEAKGYTTFAIPPADCTGFLLSRTTKTFKLQKRT